MFAFIFASPIIIFMGSGDNDLIKKEDAKINIYYAIFLATALVVAGFFIFKNKAPQEQEDIKTFSDELSSSGKNIEIPKKFPKDLPVAEANLIEAYTRDPDTKDITTIFDSRKSAKENYDYYLNYMKMSGWQIDDAIELSGASPAGISSRKENFFVNMAFEPKENNTSKITISSKLIKPIDNIDFRGLKLE